MIPGMAVPKQRNNWSCPGVPSHTRVTRRFRNLPTQNTMGMCSCTLKEMKYSLGPFQLVEKFHSKLPCVFGLLMMLVAAPTAWGKRKAKGKAQESGSVDQSEGEEISEADSEDDDGPDQALWKEVVGFLRCACKDYLPCEIYDI